MTDFFAVLPFLLMSVGLGDNVGATSTHFQYMLRGNAIVKTRSLSELQKTFLATGCTNREAFAIEEWKIKTDDVVLSDMFVHCSLTAEGKATERQRSRCCGEDSTVETCRPSCHKQSSVSVVRTDAELQKTFLATGCTNQNPPVLGDWKSQTDDFVLSDMFAYCNVNAEGRATQDQRFQCCGDQATAETCKPTCSRLYNFVR